MSNIFSSIPGLPIWLFLSCSLSLIACSTSQTEVTLSGVDLEGRWYKQIDDQQNSCIDGSETSNREYFQFGNGEYLHSKELYADGGCIEENLREKFTISGSYLLGEGKAVYGLRSNRDLEDIFVFDHDVSITNEPLDKSIQIDFERETIEVTCNDSGCVYTWNVLVEKECEGIVGIGENDITGCGWQGRTTTVYSLVAKEDETLYLGIINAMKDDEEVSYTGTAVANRHKYVGMLPFYSKLDAN